jgi:hypothetical protein
MSGRMMTTIGIGGGGDITAMIGMRIAITGVIMTKIAIIATMTMTTIGGSQFGI